MLILNLVLALLPVVIAGIIFFVIWWRYSASLGEVGEFLEIVLESEDYGKRLPGRVNGKVRDICINLNTLLERIQDSRESASKCHLDLESMIEARTQEFMAAKELAEAESEAKSQFLTNMSHEIRTPLNGVMGMLQLLEKDDLSERNRRYVATAVRSADTLLTVIGDILDFSKIKAGRLELECIEFDLRDSVDAAVRLFAEKAENKGVELSYRVSPELPAKVKGDSNRLRQVLINLVGNSMKFTESGEIFVDCRPVELGDQSMTVRFDIRDTGPGIPGDQLETVFEQFAQVDSSMRRQHSGTGLGLAISRRIVELMGGEIGVKSEMGEGATFCFTVPLEINEEDRGLREGKMVSTYGLRVLIVEESETMRDVLSEYTRSWVCHVDEARSVRESLHELERGIERNSPYAIAIVDGLETASVIRQNPRYDSTQLILLSGFYHLSQRDVADQGIAAVVPKPVRASELYNAIVNVTNGALKRLSGDQTPAGDEDIDIVPGAHILLVEDNEINQEVACAMLDMLGFSSNCLNSGVDALKAVASGRYNLVLMDCQMPVMDGYETTAMIREWERDSSPGSHIPIIAMTAHAMKGDRDRCIEAGMDDYLGKPVYSEELSAMLSKWLDGDAAGVSTASTLSDADNTVAGLISCEDIESAVVERSCGNRELAAELLQDYIAQTSEDIALMTKAVAEADADVLSRAAHRVKGASACLALKESHRVASELEEKSRQGSTDAGVLLSQLRAEVERVAGMSILSEMSADMVS